MTVMRPRIRFVAAAVSVALPLLITSRLVCAQATVELHTFDGASAVDVTNSAPISYGNSMTTAGGTASGYANLSSGVLKASATASGSDGSDHLADALSHMQDTITFSPAASGIAFLDWHWDGSLSPIGTEFNDDAATLSFSVVYGNGAGISASYVLTNEFCNAFGTPNCTVGTTIDQSGMLAIPIAAGGISISIQLAAEASDGRFVDFSNTGNFYLDVPSDVTYTSASGQFLATASPIAAPVPEPSVFALTLVGLAGLGARMRRPSRP